MWNIKIKLKIRQINMKQVQRWYFKCLSWRHFCEVSAQ